MITTIFTIIAVSTDAYIVGLSLNNLGRYEKLKIFYTSIFSFILSAVFIIVFSQLDDYASKVLKIISSCILIILGTKSMIGSSKKEGLIVKSEDWNLLSLTLLGLSIAIDGAVASILLVSSLCNLLLVPFMLMLSNFVFMCLGMQSVKLIKRVDSITKCSGAFLILLGLVRII